MRVIEVTVKRLAAAAVITAIAGVAGMSALIQPRAAADSFSSSSYRIDSSVANSFGGPGSSASYRMVSSGGEAIIGDGASGSYKLGAGYIAQLDQSIQLNVQPAGLLVNYPMDETSSTRIYDNSSGTADGSLVNNPTRAAGKMGQALSMGGTTYASSGGQRSLDVDPGESRSFSAWFKASTQSQRTYIMGQYGTCQGWTLSLDTSGNLRLLFSADSSSCASPATTSATTATTTYDDNAWHHVLATVDRPAGTLKVFVDGQLRANASGVNNTHPAADGIFVVGADGSFGSNFSGLIDEVRVYDTAYSNKAALREYTAQNAGLPSSLSFADIIPNQSQTVAARTVVQTDAPGYELALSQDGNMTDGTNMISPVSGNIADPGLWAEGTTKGLGFTLTSGASLDSKWGTNPNYEYAAVPGAATTVYSRTAQGGGTKDVVTSQFRVDVPQSQAAGEYKNTVTYTATMVP